jgi:hypothetical protein
MSLPLTFGGGVGSSVTGLFLGGFFLSGFFSYLRCFFLFLLSFFVFLWINSFNVGVCIFALVTNVLLCLLD